MSLKKDIEENLFGAHITHIEMFPEDDPFVVFSKEIYPIFNDKDFEECYSDIGRGAKSPSLLAMVTILQFKENLSDREAIDACIRRIDWKIALHLPVEETEIFHDSLLTRFRKRLKENNESSLVFDKIVKFAQDKNYIKKRTKQRIDATHIISHVNRISTTDLLFRAVKGLLEEIHKNNADYYERNIPEDMRERYENKFSSFGMSKGKRAEKMAEIIEDGYYIKSILEKIKSESLNDLEQLAIMETIFNENVVIKEKEINNKIFIEVEEIQSPKQTIFDPKDTSLQLGKKGKTSWVGSKCHIVETAEKGKVNFITGMLYQKANESDQKIHDNFISHNRIKGLKPAKIFTDQNYISGKSIHDYRQQGQELLGRIGMDTSKKPERFKLNKFKIDMVNKKAVCPTGKESEIHRIYKNGDLDICFSKTDCMVCPDYKGCVGDNKERRRRLRVNKYYKEI